jgi:hypothetical protein
MEKVLFKLLKITLVGINFLSVKKMSGPYRIDVAESKYGNQIATSPTFLRVRPIKSKTTFVVKYISGMTDWIGQIFAYVLVKFVRQLSRWRGANLAVTSTILIFA